MSPTPRFPVTSCSQCGAEFGPGDHGFSHCDQHRAATPDDLVIRDAEMAAQAVDTLDALRLGITSLREMADMFDKCADRISICAPLAGCLNVPIGTLENLGQVIEDAVMRFRATQEN